MRGRKAEAGLEVGTSFGKFCFGEVELFHIRHLQERRHFLALSTVESAVVMCWHLVLSG